MNSVLYLAMLRRKNKKHEMGRKYSTHGEITYTCTVLIEINCENVTDILRDVYR
jgi:hypothetical protein